MVPSMLARLRGDGARRVEDDGFFDRILFAYPPEPSAEAESWKHVSRDALEAWVEGYEASVAGNRSGRFDSSVSRGTIPSVFWRSSVCSR